MMVNMRSKSLDLTEWRLIGSLKNVGKGRMLGQGKKRKTQQIQDENRPPGDGVFKMPLPAMHRTRSAHLLSPLNGLKLSPIQKVDESLYGKSVNICQLCGSTEPDSCSCGSYGSLQDVPAYLEISHRGESIMTGDAKLLHPYKGQLKLSVYVNYGLLTVHVVQARHLVCRTKETCDTYVKLELVPDPSRRTRCRTEVVNDTNHPAFDEKFSFELLEEDMKRRILLSLWHKPKKGSSEFLGCMSFGVQPISSQKRTVNGWYYLLTEEVGRKKHLQVNNIPKKPLAESNINIPSVNQDVLWMEPHVVTIRRSSGGYGFSLTGCSPVKVCRVDSGSTADKSGLKTEDCIVRINGLNVSRSTAESIARIIRHCSKKIVLEVQRPRLMEGHTMANQTAGPMSSTVCQPMSSTVCQGTPAPGATPACSVGKPPHGAFHAPVKPFGNAKQSGHYGNHLSNGYAQQQYHHGGHKQHHHGNQGSHVHQPPTNPLVQDPQYGHYKYLSQHMKLEAEIVDTSYYSYGDEVPPPQLSHHSDSELEVETKSKKSMPICGTLPRKKTTVKETLL